jgi:uncharacterized protein YkwD
MPTVLLLLAAALVSQSATSQPLDTKALEEDMHRLVNIEREARGLAKLEVLPLLADIARQHSRAMAERDEVAHELDGDRFDTRIKVAVPGACHLGENITKHYTIEYALADLMGSPGHRGNILDPKYTILGIGIVQNEEGLLFITQDFIGICEKTEKKVGRK